MSGLSFLRKKQPDVKAQVRASQRDIARGNKDLEREAGALHAEEQKLVGEIKQAANRGDMASAKLLARQLVRLRTHKARLRTTGAQLRGVSASLTVRARRQLAVPLAGAVGKCSFPGVCSALLLLHVPSPMPTPSHPRRRPPRARSARRWPRWGARWPLWAPPLTCRPHSTTWQRLRARVPG
jgi:hypothetical protein